MRPRQSKWTPSGIFHLYSHRYIYAIAYMMQSCEYELAPFLRWFWRTRDIGRVTYRKKLIITKVVIGILIFGSTVIVAQYLLVGYLVYQGFVQDSVGNYFLASGVLFAQPIITAHMMIIPVLLGSWLIIKPLTVINLRKAHKIFSEHTGKVIAIAGSYGKTSMKEILYAVLSSDIETAATEGNMNTHIAHARFARKLTGKESAIIVELGEYVPGDIMKYCRIIQPDFGIITGLAPIHMHNFSNIDNAGKNLFDLAKYIGNKNVFVNDENVFMKKFITKEYGLYSRTATSGWAVSKARTSLQGTVFKLTKGKKTMDIKTGLIGKHIIGPVSLAVVLAVEEFGVKPDKVEKNIANLKSIPHRMEPKKLASGAWLIDDSYNGNIEGVRAIIDFLNEIKAKRKIYVTPGLVEQGVETISVHNEIGELLADSVDEVILMRNSTTSLIEAGLANRNFKGVLRKVDDPVEFYESFEHLVSDGDVIVLQNDWTDNYS